MYLLDINVWVALAFLAHHHHVPAKRWFDGLPDSSRCCFCRFTQQGFLRLANNPAVMSGIAMTQVEAWTLYDAFLNDPRVELMGELPQLEPIWRGLTHKHTLSTKTWSDAYLAAFAIAAGLELITFDKGFRQFKGLHHTILS